MAPEPAIAFRGKGPFNVQNKHASIMIRVMQFLM